METFLDPRANIVYREACLATIKSGKVVFWLLQVSFDGNVRPLKSHHNLLPDVNLNCGRQDLDVQ